ncbi:MAG: AMP-binding protein [Nitrospinota bacterium]
MVYSLKEQGFTSLLITRALDIFKFLLRLILWTLTHTIYRIRISGKENIPGKGPALLVCNHLTFVDPFIVGSCMLRRFIRFMMFREYFEIGSIKWFLNLMEVIPISEKDSPKATIRSFKRAEEELKKGHVVCIFPEGNITRTGNMLPFKKGFERIVKNTDAPIIPVYIDRLWGSIFSYKGGKFFWKIPERFPYPVTVSFGKPLPSQSTSKEVRNAVLNLGPEAFAHRKENLSPLHIQFLKSAKRHLFRFCMSDSSGKELSYGKVLIASLLLSKLIKKRYCLNEKMVGVILPSSIGGALANIGILMANKVPVNLNFTASKESVSSAISQCEIKTIITSKVFIEKAKIKRQEGMIYLEDVLKEIRPIKKIVTTIAVFLVPAFAIKRLYIRPKDTIDDLSTIIFSSGSTGEPKGIMLSHFNILSNCLGFYQIFQLTKNDRVMGILPFFHSFGFTGTLWFPLLSGFGVIYHPNPLDSKTIGELIERYKATILTSTPTFYQGYIKKCTKNQFASLRYPIVGAEKLKMPLAKVFKEKFGIELLEAYGCTECSPAVSLNVPDYKDAALVQTGTKLGTIGLPIPGVSLKIVDPETFQKLPNGEEGLLLVKGPNVMMGYLNQPEKTQEVIRDGWYCTGDIAFIHDDGFVEIKDRLSRFSKIGGEMVPHIYIEEAIHNILNTSEQKCVVTSISEGKKGEKLVVLYTDIEMGTEEILERMKGMEIPNLWIPGRDSFIKIDTIPLLGSGKLDLKKIKTIAKEIE